MAGSIWRMTSTGTSFSSEEKSSRFLHPISIQSGLRAGDQAVHRPKRAARVAAGQVLGVVATEGGERRPGRHNNRPVWPRVGLVPFLVVEIVFILYCRRLGRSGALLHRGPSLFSRGSAEPRGSPARFCELRRNEGERHSARMEAAWP